MRERVQNILRSWARKTLVLRAARAGAALAAGMGLASAVLVAAWIAAWGRSEITAMVCLALAGLASAAMTLPAVRSRFGLDKPVLIAAGVLVWLWIGGGAILLAEGWYGEIPKALIPPAGILLGAICGALMAIFRGVSPAQAAMHLDKKCGLDERLSTAVELSDSPQKDSAPARVVYQQSLAALEAIKGRGPVGGRSARPFWALGLAAALCLALCAVPSRGPKNEFEAIAAGIANMAPSQREEIADAFRKAARRQADNSRAREELLRTVRAIKVKDPQELSRLLAELEKAGYRLSILLPREVVAQLAAAAGKGQGAGATSVATRPALTTSRAPAGQEETPGVKTVWVYDPAIAKAVSTRPARAAFTDPDAGLVESAAAWAEARRRAQAALDTQVVPPAYRELVRRFFLADETR